MNDTTITSAISTLHRTIVSFALFVTMIGSFVFFLLKDGVYVEKVTLAGLDVEKLYIKWDEKLSILAQRAALSKTPSKKHAPLDLQAISRSLAYARFVEDFVDTVSIDTLRIGELEGSLHYNVGTRNDLNLSTPEYRLDATMRFGDSHALFTLEQFQDKTRDVRVKGNIALDFGRTEMSADLELASGTQEGLHLYALATSENASYALTSDANITSLTPFVAPFGLPHEISKWIDEYATGGPVELRSLYGSIVYADPASALRKLHAEAFFHDLSYRFNGAVDPIHSRRARVLFEDGVLNILPEAATFYRHDGGDSWLNIDFNAHPIVLNAFIRTEAQLDQDLLNLLESYHIHLPFRQTAGTTAADLNLTVTLENGHTDARGVFKTGNGRFDFRGVDLDVGGASIALNGADVTVNSLDLRYGSLIRARTSGSFNPVHHEGSLKILADSVALGDAKNPFTLAQQKPLEAVYRIDTNGDTIRFEPSVWQWGGHRFDIAGATVPFDFDTGIATPTYLPVTMDDTISADLSGTFDVAHTLVNADVTFRPFCYGALCLEQPALKLSLAYDGVAAVSVPEGSAWKLGSNPLHITPVRFRVDASTLTLETSGFDLDGLASGRVAATYDFNTSSADINASETVLQSPAVGTYFADSDPVAFMLHRSEGQTFIVSEALDLAFGADGSRWDLSLYSLDRLTPYSDLLRRYRLEHGNLQLGQDLAFDIVGISGNIRYPLALIVQNGEPVLDYYFYGNYSDGHVRLNVNEALKLDLSDKIAISSDDVGYNLGAILKLIDHDANATTAGEAPSKMPKLSLEATRSFIYFTPQRRAMADTLSLYSNDNALYARLKHREGAAIFEFKQNEFYLYGNRFGDLFMRHLLSLADYHGGELSFHINGTTDDAHGVIRVKETTVKDYKTLNNILAFVNTVPALATFSLPHYSDKGLEVIDAYAGFHYVDKIVNIEGVKVDSHEIDITGNGTVDYINNAVDMELSLSTKAGQNMSKVPLVGYILVGDKGDVMTTLKIKGALDNPEVSTGIAKGIVVAPFKMLMRTITLPFNLFKGSAPQEEKEGE